MLAYREQFHQSRLVENVVPSTPAYQEALQQATDYFLRQGAALGEAQNQAFAYIGQAVQRQAGLLGYIDVFYALMLIAALGVPLALILSKVDLGKGGGAGAH